MVTVDIANNNKLGQTQTQGEESQPKSDCSYVTAVLITAVVFTLVGGALGFYWAKRHYNV